ncbi:hypothetical protein BKA70DRAFT_117106 [Coprinopsis sp. MPI-PUGE-AT-0042]|nr:hypothetical protein BKA70DRAFT_117106 [Coprinopsis sp. MPI-PUGE-AT-0042]
MPKASLGLIPVPRLVLPVLRDKRSQCARSVCSMCLIYDLFTYDQVVLCIWPLPQQPALISVSIIISDHVSPEYPEVCASARHERLSTLIHYPLAQNSCFSPINLYALRMASLEIVQIAYVADRIDMQDEESRELAPLARDRGLSIRGNGVIRAQNVQINGGNLTSAGRDVHNHTHFHEAPQHDCEAAKADLISALESIDNFRQIQQDTLSKATPKTGEWIFEYEKFPIWRDPKSDIKTLWGSGIPGAGKTVLMSIVVNDVVRWAEEQDSTICVCYIYIRYSDNAKFTIRHCLEVLVKQTVEKHPSCLKLAENMYADHFRLHTRPTEEELFQLSSSHLAL